MRYHQQSIIAPLTRVAPKTRYIKFYTSALWFVCLIEQREIFGPCLKFEVDSINCTEKLVWAAETYIFDHFNCIELYFNIGYWLLWIKMPLAQCADPWQNLNVAQDAEVYKVFVDILKHNHTHFLIPYSWDCPSELFQEYFKHFGVQF